MRITIWHNVHRDHYNGYVRHHPMLRVFSYQAPPGDPETELWRAVKMFNAPFELLARGDRAIAADYYRLHLRSFSPGDGLSVLPEGSTAEQFWTANGAQLQPQPAAFMYLTVEGIFGSEPLGEPVTYMIPLLGGQIREGLFEVGADADLQKAIATHHGVGHADVVIISKR
ncbi:hypothetical protein [Streptomyces sp. CAU 1734]|uniref:hypothetical protein n=1 Tax=Streptomyces sp. CAU 1734 TaxID=3140360 RepID=UPI003261A820